eukprot:2434463-Prymnesium_polylepis.1
MVESKKKFLKIFAADKVCKKFPCCGRTIRRAPESRSRRPPRLPLASAAVRLVRLTVAEDSKASSTAATPKESSRKIQFNQSSRQHTVWPLLWRLVGDPETYMSARSAHVRMMP